MVEYFFANEKEDFLLNIDELISNLSPDVNMILICNPNNPTSGIIERNELIKLAKACKLNSTYLVIDEAFVPFCPHDISMAGEILGQSNLIIIRALTKIMSIPGLRVGYTLADSEIISLLNKFKEPWTLNAFASMAIMLYSTLDEYMNATKNWFISEREYLFRELSGLQGIKPYYPNANFILARLFGIKSYEMQSKLLNYNILIRDASNFIGLDDSYIRLAIKDRTNNEILINSLKEVLN